jgi:hypothetical protein
MRHLGMQPNYLAAKSSHFVLITLSLCLITIETLNLIRLLAQFQLPMLGELVSVSILRTDLWGPGEILIG